MMPELHLRLAQLRSGRGDANRAAHREFEPAAQRESVDRRHRWFSQRLQFAKNLLAAPRQSLRFDGVHLRQFADIAARDERPVAGSGQNNSLDGCVFARHPERLSQFGNDLPIQRIQLLRPVYGDERKPIRIRLKREELKGHMG